MEDPTQCRKKVRVSKKTKKTTKKSEEAPPVAMPDVSSTQEVPVPKKKVKRSKKARPVVEHEAPKATGSDVSGTQEVPIPEKKAKRSNVEQETPTVTENTHSEIRFQGSKREREAPVMEPEQRKKVRAEKICLICHQEHETANCPQRATLPTPRPCAHCGALTHRTFNCKVPRLDLDDERYCYCLKCGQPGHDKVHCPEAQCYLCKQIGHTHLICPQVTCEKCGAKGHLLQRCPVRRREIFEARARGKELRKAARKAAVEAAQLAAEEERRVRAQARQEAHQAMLVRQHEAKEKRQREARERVEAEQLKRQQKLAKKAARVARHAPKNKKQAK